MKVRIKQGDRVYEQEAPKERNPIAERAKQKKAGPMKDRKKEGDKKHCRKKIDVDQ